MAGRLIVFAVAICCTAALHAQKNNPYENVDGDVRLSALRYAQVWNPVDVASRDLKAGPDDADGFPPGALVDCRYLENKLSGTPKFTCVIPPDDKVRVKYGAENGEVYAEVAATRLLWALGFGADGAYPVSVNCQGCPEDPMKGAGKGAAATRFDPAVIERRMPGDEITLHRHSGWSWVELSFVDQAGGGSPLAHRDALKLLAALMQHTDNKPEQQRLVCLDRLEGLVPAKDGRCARPFMMLNDVGKTFGKATMGNGDRQSAVNFKAWTSVPVWKGEAGCVAHLSKSFSGSLEHPQIGEAGRAFLSGLLSQLSDQQLHDLFLTARFTTRDPSVGIDQWVDAFKRKRADIAGRRCAEPSAPTR